jgi:hypothetical protein
VNAAADARPELRVVTQGHVLTAGDLMLTLAVEATIHHLDLVTDLPEAVGPSPEGLAAAATGRTPLTDPERRALGADADRFPLFS